MTTVKSVTVLTEDNVKVVIDGSIVKFFGTLQNMMEDIDADVIELPLPNVRSCVLDIIVSWCSHHVNTVFPEEPKLDPKLKMRKNIIKDEFDIAFFKGYTQAQLEEILQATNYLEIKQLYCLICKTIAKRMRDFAMSRHGDCSTPEKVMALDEETRKLAYQLFGEMCKCDLTDEEKLELAKGEMAKVAYVMPQ